MVSKFARTIVYTVLGVAYHAQASDKTCQCTNGVADTTCEATTDKKCKSCNEGFFLAGNYCEACNVDIPAAFTLALGDHSNLLPAFTQCKKCGAGGKCTEVKSDAYYLASDIATKCHDGCTKCTEATKCKASSASDGWFLDADKKPTECADGCDKCTEAEKCTTGENEDGFRLDTDKKPEKCATGCKQCDADKAKCVEQMPQYYLDGTTVGACEANCKTCTKTECTEAASGHMVTSGEKTVKACAANCKECAAEGKCSADKAEEGYYVTAEETTAACTAGCATCDKTTTDAAKCLTAKVGYLMDADDKPQACPTGCNSCQADSNKDKTRCDANGQKIGYFLKDSVPTACETGCAKCTDATTCLIPLPTYFRNDEGSLAKCGDTCELCLGKTCIKTKEAGGGGNGGGSDVSGSVSSVLSVGVAFAVGVATTQL